MNKLLLPEGYVLIEKEEMVYIDGGFDVISVKAAGAILNAAIAIATGGLGASAYIEKYGVKQAGKLFSKTLASRIAAWGCPKLAAVVSVAIDSALNYLDVGTNIAKYIDAHDYEPNNGWLSI